MRLWSKTRITHNFSDYFTFKYLKSCIFKTKQVLFFIFVKLLLIPIIETIMLLSQSSIFLGKKLFLFDPSSTHILLGLIMENIVSLHFAPFRIVTKINLISDWTRIFHMIYFYFQFWVNIFLFFFLFVFLEKLQFSLSILDF